MKAIIALALVATLTACTTTPSPRVVYGKETTDAVFAADQAECKVAQEAAIKRQNIFDSSEQEYRNAARTKAAQVKCLEAKGYIALK